MTDEQILDILDRIPPKVMLHSERLLNELRRLGLDIVPIVEAPAV